MMMMMMILMMMMMPRQMKQDYLENNPVGQTLSKWYGCASLHPESKSIKTIKEIFITWTTHWSLIG